MPIFNICLQTSPLRSESDFPSQLRRSSPPTATGDIKPNDLPRRLKSHARDFHRLLFSVARSILNRPLVTSGLVVATVPAGGSASTPLTAPPWFPAPWISRPAIGNWPGSLGSISASKFSQCRLRGCRDTWGRHRRRISRVGVHRSICCSRGGPEGRRTPGELVDRRWRELDVEEVKNEPSYRQAVMRGREGVQGAIEQLGGREELAVVTFEPGSGGK